MHGGLFFFSVCLSLFLSLSLVSTLNIFCCFFFGTFFLYFISLTNSEIVKAARSSGRQYKCFGIWWDFHAIMIIWNISHMKNSIGGTHLQISDLYAGCCYFFFYFFFHLFICWYLLNHIKLLKIFIVNFMFIYWCL